jgi:hypothetical protein
LITSHASFLHANADSRGPPNELKAVERPFSPKKQKPTVRQSILRKQQPIAPEPDHIVVVIFENKHRSSVIGSAQAPYLNKLAAKGASMRHSYGVTHPSQPNYLALFSGSTQGVTSNACRGVVDLARRSVRWRVRLRW